MIIGHKWDTNTTLQYEQEKAKGIAYLANVQKTKANCEMLLALLLELKDSTCWGSLRIPSVTIGLNETHNF